MKRFLTIICDSEYESIIDVGANEEIDHSFLVFSNIESTSCKTTIQLMHPNSQANITILGVIRNNQKVTIDGQITIGSGGENTSGHLQEEVLLLSNQAYTFTKPVLDVRNNNVSASHGAKVHSIDKQQLFYLNARGLDSFEGKKIILSGLIQKLFVDVDKSNITIIGNGLKTQNQTDLAESILHLLIS